MKVLVTGANGFLGFNIVKTLLQNQHSVYALSQGSTRLQRIQNPSLTFRKMSLESIAQLEKPILEWDPDVVIHAAWAGGNSHKSTEMINQTDNVTAGVELLSILQKLKKTYFVGIGSTAEYGNSPLSHRWSELEAENPDSWYGLAKYTFKLYSRKICAASGFKWLWIRPCYVYGPHDVTTRLIPRAVESCVQNRHLVLNSCESVVDYLYISDFVAGLMALITKAAEGTYNISSDKEYRTRDIVTHIQDLTNQKSTITFDEKLDRDRFPTYICISSAKIRTITGWKPEISLLTGLKKTIQEYGEI